MRLYLIGWRRKWRVFSSIVRITIRSCRFHVIGISVVVPNANEYLYRDFYYGTTAANQLIAEAAYEALTVPEPSTGLLFAGGVGMLGWDSSQALIGISP